MKIQQLLYITLLLLSTFGNCAKNNDGGLDSITTPSNDDPNSCLLTLNYTLSPSVVTFTVIQNNPDPSNPVCTHKDMVFDSLFRNVTASGQITLTPSANDSNILTGTLDMNTIMSQNGVACAAWGVYNGVTVWDCRFRYSSLIIYFDVFVLSNGEFDTNWEGLLFVGFGTSAKVQRNAMDAWVSSNNSFPQIVGMLSNGCDSQSNVISSLTTPLTIKGSEYQSNIFDLNLYLSSQILYQIAVRKKDSTNSYTVYSSQIAEWKPFTSPGVNGCTGLGLTYSDIIPDLSYCIDGCDVSMGMFADGQAYLIQTNGFTTSTSRLRG